MTAKEALEIYLGGNMNVATLTPLAIEDFMRTFARYNVKLALNTASDSIKCYPSESDQILNSYPLENII
ncbi:hypothetical protein [Sphingobacterium faecium]|uniref:hypothetical protein n=1 Tax=Sphingobacterium faecium TaxID=34087 RepID=UPI002479EC5A|nr:hypothetical protein [Sphingobacterium faecium]WGQ15601.1 hypothetical protein QG727_04145 [Sphingobacterium faecium]